MVTETAGLTDVQTGLLTCPECGKGELKGPKGLAMHARWCDAPVPEGTENAPEVVAEAAIDQPAAVLGKASWRAETAKPAEMPESVRDPSSRTHNVTHAWYFATPRVDAEEMVSTTGLPMDVFHSGPSWQSHQRQTQIDADHLLVTEIDLHGQKRNGTPYVHILPPSDVTWAEIVDLWRAAIPMEIEIEREMLTQAELNLDRAVEAGERGRARTAIRVLSTRILQLESLDFNDARRFFEREHQLSVQQGRTDVQVLDDQIDDRIAAAALEGSWDG